MRKKRKNYQFEIFLMTLIVVLNDIEVVLDDGCAKLQRKTISSE